ncbi:AbrB/MazE/SpoVT family DNA-binding domain-containing protein [Candidatus Woesearchaeota archaeon]|nr:AbrB/MazE/SpoVT family DNA-binding domain-containing protein [Candidatus Woesearchaeota archaeon]
MAGCEVVTRKWGNSIGITLPRDFTEKEHIGENEKLEIIVLKKNNAAREMFGMLRGKWKKPAQQIKDELREELYDQ